ncbi:MAG: Apolipoprotein N-acyltransferase [Acidimicrobiaceae bacterium]|nr:Apolipoprotein N-acyltransferase [Acidimicrobiaceae bacterium]
MTRRAQRAFVALSPLVAGLLIGASLPPTRLWPLAPLGVALLAHSNAERRWSRRSCNGLLAGIAQFGLGCAWALQFTAVGYVVLVLVESVFVSAACAASPAGRGRRPALLGLLVLAEWGRNSWPFGGLPLGGIALGQVSGPLLALARLGGPLLVVGGVCLAGVAIESCATSLLSRRVDSGAGVRGFSATRLAGGAIALAILVAMVAVAAHAPDGGGSRRRISAVAVQGGGSRGLSALQVPAASVLAAQLAATQSVTRGASLVVWPEDSVSLTGPLDRSPIEPLLGATARRLGATLVAGVTEPAGPGRFLNQASIWAPSGHFVTSYVKVHPVPFGEYVPLRSLLSRVVSLAAVPRDAVAGHGSGMVETPAGRLALLVSYETFFPGRARAGVRAGGELLVVPTNTASYVGTQVPTQELAASRLQAVTEGRDLVQAATTGFSAVVDNHGDVLAETPLANRDVIRATVALRTGLTLYGRLGDLPVLLAALACAAGGWVAARTDLLWPRRRGAGSNAPR